MQASLPCATSRHTRCTRSPLARQAELNDAGEQATGETINSQTVLCSIRRKYFNSLPAAPDVGHRQHPAQVLAEDEARDAKARGYGDVEATVAVQQSAVSTVALKV